MQIYRGILELVDYVFYATVERGKVYETGAFVHNYALAYAFHLADAPYTHMLQEPNYQTELADLNEEGVYLSPAHPIRFSHRLMQFNTIAEGYGLAGKERSAGYPDWGFARVLRPGSRFEFYALIQDETSIPAAPSFRDALNGRTTRIRLGKFPGKVRVLLQPAGQVEQRRGTFTANALLNWRDLRDDPTVCDIYAGSLPTRLIANAHFQDGEYYVARFGERDEVRLPVRMCFLARPPIQRRRRRS